MKDIVVNKELQGNKNRKIERLENGRRRHFAARIKRMKKRREEPIVLLDSDISQLLVVHTDASDTSLAML